MLKDIAGTITASDFAGVLILNHIKMKIPWFKRIGIFFIPASLAGWLLFLVGLAYSVYTFIDIDSRSHSVSDTLINFVFNLLIIGVVYSLIAYFTCRVPKA
jgi:hypothetical protein